MRSTAARPEGDHVNRTLDIKGAPILGHVPLVFNLYAYNIVRILDKF